MASTAAPAPRSPPQVRAETLAEQLYAVHRKRLLAIARRNSACLEDAEEALQDAFVLFIDHFDASSDAPPLAWLTLTLKRRCWALYGRQRRDPGHARGGISRSTPRANTIADPRRQPDEIAEVAETVERVRAQLAELKPAEREALSLLALGYSYREICELTGWTYTKVNRCITEGRTHLRRLALTTDPYD